MAAWSICGVPSTLTSRQPMISDSQDVMNEADADGEVLDVLIQTRRNKKAALKLMRGLLTKYAFVPDRLLTDDLRSPRIRISRRGDESERCKASRAGCRVTARDETIAEESGDAGGRWTDPRPP
jgi:hypothetical protein